MREYFEIFSLKLKYAKLSDVFHRLLIRILQENKSYFIEQPLTSETFDHFFLNGFFDKCLGSFLNFEIEPILIPYRPEDPCRVINEAVSMQNPDGILFDILEAVEWIKYLTEVLF